MKRPPERDDRRRLYRGAAWGLLALLTGLLPAWRLLPEWRTGGEVSYGPTLTAWGPVSVRLDGLRLSFDATWRDAPPRVRIAVPGFAPIDAAPDDRDFQLQLP